MQVIPWKHGPIDVGGSIATPKHKHLYANSYASKKYNSNHIAATSWFWPQVLAGPIDSISVHCL